MRLQGHTARIYSLAVDPALRGQGVGGQLIRALPTHLPAQYHTLTLEVRAENSAARSLYDRLGFVVERMLPNYYPDGADGVRYMASRGQLT
jgi:ribosomal protein S18 acetylase RimI-like enzyme